MQLLDGDEGVLRKGRRTRISLKAPKAKRIFLTDGDQRSELEYSGGQYSLSFTPKSDAVIVYGGFGSSGGGRGLLRYEVR